MIEPRVVKEARLQREALLRGEAEQQAAMTRAWIKVEDRLSSSYIDIATSVITASEERPVSRSKLYQMQRYAALLVQIQKETGKYSEEAAKGIAERQQSYMLSGLKNATELLSASGLPLGSFATLPAGAVEFAAGYAANGTPLTDLLKQSVTADVVQKVTDRLLVATALGTNPRIVARRMQEDARLGLGRSLTIARTEQMRAFREASRAQYKATGAVEQYRRLATKSARSCPACIMADGLVYVVDRPFEAHPNCRCTMVPIVRGLDAPQWETGAEWLEKQSDEVQRQILGKGRHEALQAGRFNLDKLVTRRPSDEWGNALVPTSLRDLLAGKGGVYNPTKSFNEFDPAKIVAQKVAPAQDQLAALNAKRQAAADQYAQLKAAGLADDLPVMQELKRNAGDLLKPKPASSAPASIDAKADKQALEAAKALGLGKYTPEQLARLVGPLSGARVKLRAAEKLDEFDEDAIEIDIDHKYYKANRRIVRDERGRTVIENVSFDAKPGAPKGLGVRALHRQATAANQAGIKTIRTLASGEPGTKLNGYYTWPRIGYNGEIPATLRANMPKELRSSKTTHELFDKPGGAEWWKKNGYEHEAEFDTGPNSEHMKRLRRYAEVTGIDPESEP